MNKMNIDAASIMKALPSPLTENLRSQNSIQLTKNLGLKIGNRWLFHELNLDAQVGFPLCIVGGSGAGKTSLFRVLSGEINATEGESYLHKFLRPSEIAVIHQDLRLNDELSLIDNVISGRLYQRAWWQVFAAPPESWLTEAEELLKRLGFSREKHDQLAKRASGGERQRVAIARSLFQRPKVILADEPVSQLDDETARQALELVCESALKTDCSLLISLHQTQLIEDFQFRTLRLENRP